ncbi:hypothetical protein [Bradyrhizobium cajani]|uniref:Uncharacterized protein n=1 Tax=Bradyrhizobium cajani TaxID=1928661 RepID=A0A844T9T7_9BRAD|nr:hypothetical protein [Bradyrhizobium cajani]MCP3370768.1 hypothetical protein [Bradyrhizobium cajani]MVT75873.1 hypothetical protein [Bradyrhizobium cajani]
MSAGADRATFNAALDAYKPVSDRHADFVMRWKEHPSKAELWLALSRAAAKHGLPVPEPADFIGVTLGCTMEAARLNDHSKSVRDDFDKIKREIVQVVEDADYPLNLWRDLERFETALRELDHSDYDMHAPAAGGRNDVHGSRNRRVFAQRLARYLREVCGEALIDQVAEMVDIVFATEAPTDPSLVRRWLGHPPGRVV